MAVPAPRYLPAPLADDGTIGQPEGADEPGEFVPLDAAPSSPAARMQWELYQRFSAERHPPVTPYPFPARVALLAGSGAAAWTGLYWLARTLLSIAR